MTDLLTAAGLIIAVLLAYLQIQKTQTANIKAQEAHLRNELKVRLYERCAEVFQDAADHITAATSDARSVVMSLQLTMRGHPLALRTDSRQLLEVQHRAQSGVTRVLIVLEQYEIAFARFSSIRRELAEEHTRLLDAHSQYWRLLLPLVPLYDERTGNALPPFAAPTTTALTELEAAQSAYIDVCNTLSSYLIDLQIEAQNELLGGLFGQQLPLRSPLDSALRVLTRDPVAPTERPPGRIV